MNPKITISIDTKNKAIVTLTGMVTVGSKVDIEISGLPDSIPNWREIDPYTGKSLRFRVVDCLGNDLVRYPLVKKGNETDGDTWYVDADGVYANSDGCEVEFNTHKLRHAFNQVPFNEYMELGIILDSFVDSAEYAIGKIKVRQWSSASIDNPTILPDWREILHGLKADLESVNQSKASAAASATQSAISAVNADASASLASASESSAADYAAVANEAKEDAIEAVLKYPYIDEFGHWRVWSIVAGEWVDHGEAVAHYDDEVTETSEHGVKSSGIWNWVKSLLPDWLNKNYAEPATTASVSAEEQRAKAIELDLRRRVENLGSSKADKTTTYTKSETDAKITANVENSVTSTSTTKALSANMGKELQDQIQNLKHSKADEAKPSFSTITINGVDYTEWTLGTRSGKIMLSVDMGGISTEIAAFNPVTGVFVSALSQYRDTLRFDGEAPIVGASPTLFDHVARESALSGKANISHTHTKSEITDFPTEMPPTAHSHANDGWFTTAIEDVKLWAKSLLPDWLTPSREEPPTHDFVLSVEYKANNARDAAQLAENKAEDALVHADEALAGLDGKANASDFSTSTPASYVTDFVQQSAILQARIKSVAQSLIRTAFANFDPNEQSFADLVNILKNIGA